MDRLTLFLFAALVFIFSLFAFSRFIFGFAFILGIVTAGLVALWAFVSEEKKGINPARTSKAGITLSACSGIIGVFLWYYLFFMYRLPYQISGWTGIIVLGSLVLVLSIAGLALYVRGRKTFWEIERELNERVLLDIMGAIITTWGFWFGLGFYATGAYVFQGTQ